MTKHLDPITSGMQDWNLCSIADVAHMHMGTIKGFS